MNKAGTWQLTELKQLRYKMQEYTFIILSSINQMRAMLAVILLV